MGPGRYRAMTAVMSSMDLGLSPTHTPVMPTDSSWNTPLVCPSVSILNVSGSSSGTLSTRKSGSARRTRSSASFSTVRFRRPRKSILSRPSCSSVTISNWQTMDSSFLARGT